jgi:hypothetical protein
MDYQIVWLALLILVLAAHMVKDATEFKKIRNLETELSELKAKRWLAWGCRVIRAASGAHPYWRPQCPSSGFRSSIAHLSRPVCLTHCAAIR